jgi:hypothetical protein
LVSQRGRDLFPHLFYAEMRRISYLPFILILLLIAMTKCIGCGKDFAARGFKTHIKSCKLYKNKKIADILPKLPDKSAHLEVFGIDSGQLGSSSLVDDPPINDFEVNKILVALLKTYLDV